MKSIFILAISIMMTLSVAADSLQHYKNNRQYLGVSLPESSLFTPLVIEHSDKRTVVARVTYTQDRRDIEVLENRGRGWRPLGNNGSGITGIDGTFLISAIITSDERIWVLACHRNPASSCRWTVYYYLYVHDNDHWRLAGPTNGAPTGSISSRGLGIMDTKLVNLYMGYDRQHKRNKPFLKYLDDDTWKSAGVEVFLQNTPGHTYWAGSDLWHIVCESTNGYTQVDVYVLKGIDTNSISGPHHLIRTKGEYELSRFDASIDGDLAILLANYNVDDKTDLLAYTFRQHGVQTWSDGTRLPPPPVNYTPEWFGWSPRQELIVMHTPAFESVVIYAFREDKWITIAEGKQTGIGMIYNPRLTFSRDGEPIVTWEDFLPCGELWNEE